MFIEGEAYLGYDKLFYTSLSSHNQIVKKTVEALSYSYSDQDGGF